MGWGTGNEFISAVVSESVELNSAVSDRKSCCFVEKMDNSTYFPRTARLWNVPEGLQILAPDKAVVPVRKHQPPSGVNVSPKILAPSRLREGVGGGLADLSKRSHTNDFYRAKSCQILKTGARGRD